MRTLMLVWIPLALSGCLGGGGTEPLDAAGEVTGAAVFDGPVIVRDATYPWHVHTDRPTGLGTDALYLATATVAPICLTSDGDPFVTMLDLLQEGPLPAFGGAGNVSVTLAWDLTDFPGDHLYVAYSAGTSYKVSDAVANGASAVLPARDEAEAWGLSACLAEEDDGLPLPGSDYEPKPFLGDLDVRIEFLA